MELSLLCEVKVMLCVMDKNDKMVIYCSDAATLPTMQTFMMSEGIQKEYLSNIDYKEMFYEATKQSETGLLGGSGKHTDNSYTTDNEASSFENDKLKPVEKKKSTFFSMSKYQCEIEKTLIKDLAPESDQIITTPKNINSIIENEEREEKCKAEDLNSLENLDKQEKPDETLTNVQIFVEKKVENSTSSRQDNMEHALISEAPVSDENSVHGVSIKYEGEKREIKTETNLTSSQTPQPNSKTVNKDFNLFLNTLSSKMNGNMTNQFQKNQLNSLNNISGVNGMINNGYNKISTLETLNGINSGIPMLNTLGGLNGVNALGNNFNLMDLQQLQTYQMLQSLQAMQNYQNNIQGTLPQGYNPNVGQTHPLLQNYINNSQLVNSLGGISGLNGLNGIPGINSLNSLNNINNLNTLNLTNQASYNLPPNYNSQNFLQNSNKDTLNLQPPLMYNNQNPNALSYLISSQNQTNLNVNNSKIFEALLNYQQSGINSTNQPLSNNIEPGNFNFSQAVSATQKNENDYLHKRYRDESFSNFINPSHVQGELIGNSFSGGPASSHEAETNKGRLDKSNNIKDSCKDE